MLFDKSSLSPYIRFGCLSVRYFLFEVKKLASKDPTIEPLLKDVTGKLLQREFYCTVAKQVIDIIIYTIASLIPTNCMVLVYKFYYPWNEDAPLDFLLLVDMYMAKVISHQIKYSGKTSFIVTACLII